MCTIYYASEMADYLGLSKSAVLKMLRTGKIKTRKVFSEYFGHMVYYIDNDVLNQFLEKYTAVWDGRRLIISGRVHHTPESVAKLLYVSDREVRRWIENKELKAKKEHGKWIISKPNLIKFIRKRYPAQNVLPDPNREIYTFYNEHYI